MIKLLLIFTTSLKIVTSIYITIRATLNTLLSKHSPWWRLAEEFLKTSWRHLQCDIFCLPRGLQDMIGRRLLRNVLKTSSKHVLKTSWKLIEESMQRHLEDVFGRRIAITYLSSFWLSSVKCNGKRCQACLNIHKTNIFESFQTK